MGIQVAGEFYVSGKAIFIFPNMDLNTLYLSSMSLAYFSIWELWARDSFYISLLKTYFPNRKMVPWACGIGLACSKEATCLGWLPAANWWLTTFVSLWTDITKWLSYDFISTKGNIIAFYNPTVVYSAWNLHKSFDSGGLHLLGDMVNELRNWGGVGCGNHNQPAMRDCV